MPDKDFFRLVYQVCRAIPYGKITTYGTIAHAIGSPGASRMVGWALNKSLNVNPPVPAHRVLNRLGCLSGKKAFGDPKRMANLLRQEGHKIEKDQLIDFKEVLWVPNFEDWE